ncbi:MAG: hypothetical protein KDD43_00320 [Bdellovibrionales bacterium]|nr:hypothetical protein [Bdellovibrionales bacterium]
MRPIIVALALIIISPLSHADEQVFVGNNQVSEVDYHSYYFGRVPVNQMSTTRFVVTNTGDSGLTFESAYISGVGYSAWHTCENGLRPQEKCSFEIRYWPPFTGIHSGRFQLNFAEESSVVIDLMGEGYR